MIYGWKMPAPVDDFYVLFLPYVYNNNWHPCSVGSMQCWLKYREGYSADTAL